MSQQNIAVLTLTVIASEAISACRAVDFDGAAIAAQGGKAMGIAMSAATSGAALAVVTHGTAVAEAGAAITRGQALIADAQGRVIPATSALRVAAGATPVTSSAANGAILEGGDPPEFILGDALQPAASAGDFIEILLRR
ncbi:MAG: DUF2190 family protein [Magnetococcales bacterium]|nr:DUF2190 family protein [Magnetococcales bacterium]MBF0262462.1 DUF2190 family protein [Magnetococcales bacterium]